MVQDGCGARGVTLVVDEAEGPLRRFLEGDHQAHVVGAAACEWLRSA
jgi:hypothetical protein